jgi:hypothetical protein
MRIQIQNELVDTGIRWKERRTPTYAGKSIVSLATSACKHSNRQLKSLVKKLALSQMVTTESEQRSTLFVARHILPSDESKSQIYKRACNLVSEIVKFPETKSLLANLKDEDAQCMVDFLNKVSVL